LGFGQDRLVATGAFVRGVRSPGWLTARNVERAQADGHPEPALLKALATAITDDPDPADVSRFDPWQAT
jgi:hypothetical protein